MKRIAICLPLERAHDKEVRFLSTVLRGVLTDHGRLSRSVRAIALGVIAVASCAATPSSATVRIADDYGGRIGTYIERFEKLRDLGENVEIDGDCVSACTLLLRYIPPDRVCVTPKARLGFHTAWKPGFLGLHFSSDAGTQILLDSYPAGIRAWLLEHGGLSSQMVYLSGAQLRTLYKPCIR